MNENFLFDVFLSHSSKDQDVVREVANRLRNDGLKVWFDEWEVESDDDRPAKIEEGLERSRVLVLCLSANALGSDWAQLEAGAFRFRDPLNNERRFIPLRLDDAPIKGSLGQFFFVEWNSVNREQEYLKLLEACQPPATPEVVDIGPIQEQSPEKSFDLGSDTIYQWAFSTDGKRILAGSGRASNTLRLWDEAGDIQQVFEGHTSLIKSVALSNDKRHALSGAEDFTVRLWDVATGRCLRVFEGHSANVGSVAWSPDEGYVLTGSSDNTMRLWDIGTGECVRIFGGHSGFVSSISWSQNQKWALSGSYDNTMRLWEVETGRCLRVFEGHTGTVWSVVLGADQRRALSGSEDRTVRLWDVETGGSLHTFRGHSDQVRSVLWSADQSICASGSWDATIRVWDVGTGLCQRVLRGRLQTENDGINTIGWGANQRYLLSGSYNPLLQRWDVSELLTKKPRAKRVEPVSVIPPDQVQYTNAKVLLVGESGVGKTGLSKRLAANEWQATDSTVGAWATHWKLPVSSSHGFEREIWLWDFGGQADQRLIHQLYMDETALAVLVFDGQKEDVFETLGQWDRDLTRASRKEFAKLLVAGRVDAGGLRVSRDEIGQFAEERGFKTFLETSAKTGLGCQELKSAILSGINWDDLPCRTTEVLFRRLKEEIVSLKDEGRVLIRFNELRETLQLRLSGEFKRFTDEELRTVLTLLAGPGVVWELAFGSWILLQPERINAYAQAVIRTLQEDAHQRGCLMEEQVLKGDLAYESSMSRLEGDEERFVLHAMHQTLAERGLCLRQPTEKGNLLIFPSYYRRERPELVKFPAVLVTYTFIGFLDEIYATLVVRLHHTDSFQQDELWRYAADFKTNTGKQLGVKLTRLSAGKGALEVYFDPSVSMEEKIIFSKYVHEHLLQHARDVERLRHYVCESCGTPVGNREVAMKRLHEWLQNRPTKSEAGTLFKFHKAKKPPSIICVECEKKVPLWDELEQCFASPEIQQRVRDMQKEVTIELSNQSKERALVGEVISTVALADQICREFSVSDHGIDMEIEFTDDDHEATGAKIYLQLKSGNSYLRSRKRDGREIFTIKDERHVRYWMAQAFPVLLVIRNSEGEVRWMEVRDWLKHATNDGKNAVSQIVFEGERFDVMSVRRWRERVLTYHAA